jgi:hypothetical protein
MKSKLIAVVAVFVLAAATIAAIAAARPRASRQEVAIEVTGGSDVEPFVLTPVTSGTVAFDKGKATFCCWTARHVVRGGQTLDLDNPEMTLVGKHGTLVTRNEIVWMDIPNGAAIYTGTWKVVRATGAYAGLTGGGIAAGFRAASGKVNARFTGSLSAK